jgi:hypothetical protein
VTCSGCDAVPVEVVAPTTNVESFKNKKLAFPVATLEAFLYTI